MARTLLLALRVLVAAVLAAALLYTLAQRAWDGAPWWVELSRYAPYAWALWPVAAALAASLVLGWRWVAASAFALVLLLVVQMDLQLESGDDPGDQAVQRVRVLTWNVKAIDALARAGGAAELAAEIARHRPDIVLAQDADNLLNGSDDPPRSDRPIWGFTHVHALGQYIVASRWPLRDCDEGQIDFRARKRRYLRCTADVDGLALSLVTAHFHTPRGALMAARRRGAQAQDAWQTNFDDRMSQARALARELAGRKRPLIVAGDLNATPGSPVLDTLQGAGLRDAFDRAGRGWGFTYGHTMRGGGSFLRIDHVLASPDVGVARAFVGGGEASQHRPVIADLWVRRAATPAAAGTNSRP